MKNSTTKPNPKAITKKAIRRAVASSTAIETGQSIDDLELKLRSGKSKFRHIKLAS